jgi:hypothetical protein
MRRKAQEAGMMDHRAEDGIAVAALEPVASGVVLLFAAGQRSSAEQIDRLIGQLPEDSMLSVSYSGEADRGCLELLCRGLTFDLKGLSPADGAPMPVVRQRAGLGGSLPEPEAVVLSAGGHLVGGAHLRPVLRAHLQLALMLAVLPGLTGMVWAPSGVLMRPQDFILAVGGWLQGGCFPAPGLVALLRGEDGALSSHGLSFFTPREVRVNPVVAGLFAVQEEIASMLIDRLVDGDGHVPAWLTDSEGRVWNVSWAAEQGLVAASAPAMQVRAGAQGPDPD